MQTVLQLGQDVCEIRDRALFGFKDVDALDPIPEFSLLAVIKAVARVIGVAAKITFQTPASRVDESPPVDLAQSWS